MHATTPMRLRAGALGLAVACAGLGLCGSAAAQALPAIKPGQIANNFEQLRVTAVADQLIAYLIKASAWVDRVETRLPSAALAERVRDAVLAHPEVRLSLEQRQTASLATREAFAGFLPQVSGNVESGWRSNDLVSTPWSNVPAFKDNTRALALSARQLVYDFGAVGSQVDARTSLQAAAAARAEIKTSELTLRALTAWLEMFRAREVFALSQMNVASRQQILSFIDERERLGGSPKSDVLRARARLADALAVEVAAKNRLSAAEAGYREAFDAPPPPPIALPVGAVVTMGRYANLGDWVSRNANVAEARAQTEAAGHEAKSATASLLPSIQFEVSARRRDLGGEGVPGLDWTAGFSVKQNLYSGGADVARKQQADQRAVESRLAEDKLRRQVERAFAQAMADVNNSAAAVAARKEAAQVAAVALEAVREQFAFRRGTLLDLLRAQEELYAAGRDLIDGIVDESLVRYRLLDLAMELTPLFGIPLPGAAAAN
jgi:adhesin transport system outer membrane protein